MLAYNFQATPEKTEKTKKKEEVLVEAEHGKI